ncbi:hypothetical protein L596_001240 [Steinernema carpocapsae]|uniref:Uncharacterized protein n=1 Tax=Steinernema carpocapsae TaxID=34508 RepID=A0A4U8UPQ3_STECR|nr:hypothetical protein L596_001240 [Steinernema carpocapsae]
MDHLPSTFYDEVTGCLGDASLYDHLPSFLSQTECRVWRYIANQHRLQRTPFSAVISNLYQYEMEKEKLIVESFQRFHKFDPRYKRVRAIVHKIPQFDNKVLPYSVILHHMRYVMPYFVNIGPQFSKLDLLLPKKHVSEILDLILEFDCEFGVIRIPYVGKNSLEIIRRQVRRGIIRKLEIDREPHNWPEEVMPLIVNLLNQTQLQTLHLPNFPHLAIGFIAIFSAINRWIENPEAMNAFTILAPVSFPLQNLETCLKMEPGSRDVDICKLARRHKKKHFYAMAQWRRGYLALTFDNILDHNYYFAETEEYMF